MTRRMSIIRTQTVTKRMLRHRRRTNFTTSPSSSYDDSLDKAHFDPSHLFAHANRFDFSAFLYCIHFWVKSGQLVSLYSLDFFLIVVSNTCLRFVNHICTCVQLEEGHIGWLASGLMCYQMYRASNEVNRPVAGNRSDFIARVTKSIPQYVQRCIWWLVDAY